MPAWVTQEDREKMIEKFTANRKKNRGKKAVVKIEEQNPVEVSFLSPEELEERRKGKEFGERIVPDRNRPRRPGQFVIVPSRRGRA